MKKGAAIAATPFFVLPQLFRYRITQIPNVLQSVELLEFESDAEHFLHLSNHHHVGERIPVLDITGRHFILQLDTIVTKYFPKNLGKS